MGRQRKHIRRSVRGRKFVAGIKNGDRYLYEITTNKGTYLFSGAYSEEALKKAEAMKDKIGFVTDVHVKRRL